MTESYIEKKIRFQGLVNGYLDTPFNQRMPLTQFRKVNGIRKDIYEQLKEGYNFSKRDDQLIKIRKAQAIMSGEEQDPQAWLDEHFLEVVKYTFESAKKGNAQSQKLFAQLAGKLVEKSEVKIGLSAEEIYRRYLAEQRELTEFRASLDIGTEKV